MQNKQIMENMQNEKNMQSGQSSQRLGPIRIAFGNVMFQTGC